MQDQLVVEFESQYALYESFRTRLEQLLSEFIDDAGLEKHSIASRVKELDSLQGKLSRKNGKYSHLGEITDIVGVRIITYYEHDVDLIGDIIKREFVLDNDNSVDKRDLLEPEKFGYLSRHYVVSLSEQRLDLSENKKFRGLKAEVQVRSILQHAWAEIEHDLGYKSEQAIPKNYRRSFARLAGLLELADEEFNRIRAGLTRYEAQVVQDINTAPSDVELNKISLNSYVLSSEVVNKIDLAILEWTGGHLGEPSDNFKEHRLNQLLYFNMETIAEVDNYLKIYQDTIISFAVNWMKRNSHHGDRIARGISIFYLGYVLITKRSNLEQIVDYLNRNNIGGPDDDSTTDRAMKLLLTAKQVGVIATD